MAEKASGKARKKTASRAPARPKAAATAKSKTPGKGAPHRIAAKKAAAKMGPAKTAPGKASRPKAGSRTAAKAKPAPPRSGARARRSPPGASIAALVATALGSNEEETIESAKYQVAGAPRRLFEEERFIFPDTYGINRIRLLVKDPEWLFVHWDVDPESLAELRGAVGERTVALSKLTLRIADPGNGGMSVVLLPPGVRSWYVRADTTRRAYRAELGLTLPSGEFRCLAESNTIVTPRVGPSAERARRVLLYKQAQLIPSDVALAVGAEEVRSASAASSASGPWSPERERDAPELAGAGERGNDERTGPGSGGASDAFRPGGASDVHRR